MDGLEKTYPQKLFIQYFENLSSRQWMEYNLVNMFDSTLFFLQVPIIISTLKGGHSQCEKKKGVVSSIIETKGENELP